MIDKLFGMRLNRMVEPLRYLHVVKVAEADCD